MMDFHRMDLCFSLVFYMLTFIGGSFSQLSDDREELLNWCLKSQSHKSAPGKEDSLHSQCTPWKEHACCTQGVTRSVHDMNMYNFSFDHCLSETKKPLSSECKKHFIQDSCFYECEPHIGMWVVKTNRKIAEERIFNVPLCARDCDAWFDACKDDFTCAYNWPRDFKFSRGRNTCPQGSKCISFKEMYTSAKDFCESVWDHSWVYTSEDKPCMKMWFEESNGNPNRQVAEHYISEYLITDGAENSCISQFLIMLSLTFCIWNVKKVIQI